MANISPDSHILLYWSRWWEEVECYLHHHCLKWIRWSLFLRQVNQKMILTLTTNIMHWSLQRPDMVRPMLPCLIKPDICGVFSTFRLAEPLRFSPWVQFGPGWHAYAYLCYGLHVMLNVVADKQGVGASVLIRSCAPVTGMHCSLIPYRYLHANAFVHAQMY
jgi:hypothetical protein